MFKSDMHKAIREGRKTVTRRLGGLKEINKEPDAWTFVKAVRIIPPVREGDYICQHSDGHCIVIKPRYQVGEVVYIKEANKLRASDDGWDVQYKDGYIKPCNIAVDLSTDEQFFAWTKNWRSPLFMPAWAARTFIQFTDVRPERLQTITEEDAVAEGITLELEPGDAPPAMRYATLWDAINPLYPWASNPHVWREAFKVVQRQETRG